MPIVLQVALIALVLVLIGCVVYFGRRLTSTPDSQATRARLTGGGAQRLDPAVGAPATATGAASPATGWGPGHPTSPADSPSASWPRDESPGHRQSDDPAGPRVGLSGDPRADASANPSEDTNPRDNTNPPDNAKRGEDAVPAADISEADREDILAEGRAAGLEEGHAAGYAQGRRAGRNEAKAAALVEARLTAKRQVSAEFDSATRDKIRTELADEVRAQVRDELDAEIEAARAEAMADAKATRDAAMRMRVQIAAEVASSRRQAELDVSALLLESRKDAEREHDRIVQRARALQDDTERRESRLAEREQRLDAELDRIEARSRDLEDAESAAKDRDAELDARERSITGELERIATLTADDAKAELLAAQESTIRRESALMARQIEQTATAEATTKAKAIVADAIARVASEQTAESVVAVMHLPSDDMKGRIIGREGRNIRAFETITGVNLIIDDTPEAVLLSCFDPVRREIGRLTLSRLVEDGRIHPHRIEEAYERSVGEVDEICQRAAEDALVEVGIDNLHPELMKLLGRLRFRTSYGQNVLLHLIETAHIAAAMAAELGVPVESVKRGAFLHDIGKAVTHEMEGSHALIGGELARKYGESEEVAHAIEAHHNEVMPQTIEAVLTQASDSCSGGRPGARRESVEAYAQRLERIEEIAGAKDGVEKVFAMQAGREVRVMVKPDEIDDAASAVLAREVAAQIEDELTYPGQIRVTVVRESRATEIAR
ncbi:ribonuclease Y [Epidermidibacterium keratini]|uniref:Ribonuclease Y n=1 Tax=Epidermidibacterium keratini TaxID=1891644 RepID=A0A7L4YRT5_9ACTN|nr:ribonuclease Y [Epidermidibacterium keratini]QHC01925.1 ribonuclease Y [Epidermidibacterium keratini]